MLIADGHEIITNIKNMKKNKKNSVYGKAVFATQKMYLYLNQFSQIILKKRGR